MSGLAALLAGHTKPDLYRWHNAAHVEDVAHAVEAEATEGETVKRCDAVIRYLTVCGRRITVSCGVPRCTSEMRSGGPGEATGHGHMRHLCTGSGQIDRPTGRELSLRVI